MVLIPYERNWNTDNEETNEEAYDVDPELYAFKWVHSTQQEDSKLHSRLKKKMLRKDKLCHSLLGLLRSRMVRNTSPSLKLLRLWGIYERS